MRSYSYAVRYSVMFGLGLFVCALLLLPTAALADTIEIRLDGYRLRLYENTGITSANFEQLDTSGTQSQYIRKYIYDDDGLSGTADPSYQYTDPTIDRVYDYSVDLNDSNPIGYEYYRSDTFQSGSGAVNNSFLGIFLNLGNTVLSKDQQLRVFMPTNSFKIEAYESSTSSNTVDVGATVESVWTGTSVNSLQKATKTGGAYVVAQSTSQILIKLNTSGRSAANLNRAHSYIMYGCPRLFIDVPSADAQAINSQSQQNTTNITNKLQSQTNSINSNQDANTDRLLDTTGSDTVAGGALQQYQGLHDDNQAVRSLDGMADAIKTAVTSNAMQRVVRFPGISLMGFEIAEQDVAIPDNVLGLLQTIRFITTFCFVCYFFRFLYCWVDAIWGLNDLQMPLNYEWLAEEEDLSTGRRRYV